jgi:TolB protein
MEDVKYTRIFQLLPKEHYGYIRPLDLDKIFFKDWDSVQARLLVTGEVREDGGRIVFDGKIYDVKSERFIVGKRYQAEKNGLRLVAHKMADELLKLHGEKPIFTTKIAFVSNRDGNDEIYIMDYDGANATRVTFNKIKDYMPAWSPDQRTIAFTSYRGGTAGLYLRNIYEGTETAVSTKGLNYSAAFSPDGKKLAFCSTMAEEGNADIFVMDLETRKTKRLTFNAATETAPPGRRRAASWPSRPTASASATPRSTSWTPRARTSARPASAATTTTRRPGHRRASASPSSPGSTTPSTSTSSTSGPTRSRS